MSWFCKATLYLWKSPFTKQDYQYQNVGADLSLWSLTCGRVYLRSRIINIEKAICPLEQSVHKKRYHCQSVNLLLNDSFIRQDYKCQKSKVSCETVHLKAVVSVKHSSKLEADVPKWFIYYWLNFLTPNHLKIFYSIIYRQVSRCRQ